MGGLRRGSTVPHRGPSTMPSVRLVARPRTCRAYAAGRRRRARNDASSGELGGERTQWSPGPPTRGMVRSALREAGDDCPETG